MWKVIINENGIQFRNSFGKTKIIAFEDIEKVKCKRTTSGQITEAILYSKDVKKPILGLSVFQKGFGIVINHLEDASIKFE